MSNNQDKSALKILIDGVFFQISQSGIARVWTSLLEQWATTEFAKQILVLDRAGTAPKIAGISYRTIPAYDYTKTDIDRQMLQQVCDEEKARWFISTYYTTPISTPSIFMAYDMIPELLGTGLDSPMWREKHQAIHHASAYLAISENTAKDLVKFFPHLSNTAITVAHCGIKTDFTLAKSEVIQQFKTMYQITRPYFLLVGDRIGWQGYKNTLLFFQSFSQLKNRQDFDIVCVGGQPKLEPELAVYTIGSQVHLLRLTDEELKAAYSGALALVYPSKYEGFGLPIVEAMACGCPVITCPTGSIPEVAGGAALYVDTDAVEGLVRALQQVQQLVVREPLIQLGLARAKQFSWATMAKIVRETLEDQASLCTPGVSASVPEIVVVTSLSTQRSLARQQQAMASWQQLGFTVVSLNNQDEMEKLQPSFNNVIFHPVSRDAQADTDGLPLVYFDDLLAYLRTQGSQICGITHPDVCLHTDSQFLPFVRHHSRNTMMFGSSILDVNLSSPEVALAACSWGMDVCFFDKSCLNQFPSSTFCLGIPWSDHWLLLFALNQGIPVKYFATPIAYFMSQQANYSIDTWYRYGIYFAECFVLTNDIDHLRKLHSEDPAQLRTELHKIVQQVVQTIYQRSQLAREQIEPREHTVVAPERAASVEQQQQQQQRQLRYQIAQQWLKLTADQLESAYTSEFGKTHQSLLNSGIKDQPMTAEELAFANTLRGQITKGFSDPQAIQYLLVATLYWRADQLPIQYWEVTLPGWWFNDYLKFMLATPTVFTEKGEADSYYYYFQGWLNYLHSFIFNNQGHPLSRQLAVLVAQNANAILLYFTATPNLKELYQKRADIFALALQTVGCMLPYHLPPKRAGAKKTKIRLGILKDHFAPQTETHALLPVFEYLDRAQFEIILYAVNGRNVPLEQYCASRADRFVTLPTDLKEQAQSIRNDDLDILFFGSNLTAVANPSTLLALHRLARVQVTSIASPVSCGMTTMDYYIAGQWTVPPREPQSHYQEKLVTVNGSGICFSYPLPEPAPVAVPTRSQIEESVVFISGANFFKIIPEIQETWAKILVHIPHAILVLYPFNPNWTNNYPTQRFVLQMQTVLARYGIASQRLVIINPLPSSADIRECLKVADIYLDSYPYGGAASLIDPLQVGLPTVVREGEALRFRQASALLRELQVPELIVNSEEAYINLAVSLATRRELRLQFQQRILQRMKNSPPFLDSRSYAAKIGKLLQKLVKESPKK